MERGVTEIRSHRSVCTRSVHADGAVLSYAPAEHSLRAHVNNAVPFLAKLFHVHHLFNADSKKFFQYFAIW